MSGAWLVFTWLVLGIELLLLARLCPPPPSLTLPPSPPSLPACPPSSACEIEPSPCCRRFRERLEPFKEHLTEAVAKVIEEELEKLQVGRGWVWGG